MNGDWVLASWDADGVQISQCHLPETSAGSTWSIMHMGGSNDPLHMHAWAGGSLPPINCSQYMLNFASSASSALVKAPPPVHPKSAFPKPPAKQSRPADTSSLAEVHSNKAHSTKQVLTGVAANPKALRGMKATGPVPTMVGMGTDVVVPKKKTGKPPKAADRVKKKPAASEVTVLPKAPEESGDLAI